MENLVIFIPLLPLLAASCIGVLHLFDILEGEKSERITARIAQTSIALSCLLALVLLGTDLFAKNNLCL